MDTSIFEDKFLGQDAAIEITSQGMLVSITLKYFPNVPIELSERYKKELEQVYKEQIKKVLQENERDAIEWEKHIRLESDRKNFI